MKVNKIATQPEFQPVTLQITIESQEELDAIKKLTGMNCTITTYLGKQVPITNEQRHTCSVFLGSIYQELNK